MKNRKIQEQLFNLVSYFYCDTAFCDLLLVLSVSFPDYQPEIQFLCSRIHPAVV